jgi:hypothetical protein
LPSDAGGKSLKVGSEDCAVGARRARVLQCRPMCPGGPCLPCLHLRQPQDWHVKAALWPAKAGARRRLRALSRSLVQRSSLFRTRGGAGTRPAPCAPRRGPVFSPQAHSASHQPQDHVAVALVGAAQASGDIKSSGRDSFKGRLGRLQSLGPSFRGSASASRRGC